MCFSTKCQKKEQLRVVLGTFALWFGWYGFNPGSTLSMHDKEMGALAAQVAMRALGFRGLGGFRALGF